MSDDDKQAEEAIDALCGALAPMLERMGEDGDGLRPDEPVRWASSIIGDAYDGMAARLAKVLANAYRRGRRVGRREGMSLTGIGCAACAQAATRYVPACDRCHPRMPADPPAPSSAQKSCVACNGLGAVASGEPYMMMQGDVCSACGGTGRAEGRNAELEIPDELAALRRVAEAASPFAVGHRDDCKACCQAGEACATLLLRRALDDLPAPSSSPAPSSVGARGDRPYEAKPGIPGHEFGCGCRGCRDTRAERVRPNEAHPRPSWATGNPEDLPRVAAEFCGDWHIRDPKIVEDLAKLLEETRTIDRERRGERAQHGPPLVSTPNGDAGDVTVTCSSCGEERDAPHSWQECAAELRSARDGMTDAAADREQSQVEAWNRLRAVKVAARAVVAELRDGGTDNAVLHRLIRDLDQAMDARKDGDQ